MPLWPPGMTCSASGPTGVISATKRRLGPLPNMNSFSPSAVGLWLEASTTS